MATVEYWTNERRADVASDALRDFLGRGDAEDLVPAVASIEDVLVCIAHLCDRCDLPPAATFHDALRRYRQNLEGDERASVIADGIYATLKEIRDHVATDTERAGAAAHPG